jgi:hypothetical protein
MNALRKRTTASGESASQSVGKPTMAKEHRPEGGLGARLVVADVRASLDGLDGSLREVAAHRREVAAVACVRERAFDVGEEAIGGEGFHDERLWAHQAHPHLLAERVGFARHDDRQLARARGVA